MHLEGRCQEAPELPEHDRQRDQEPRPDRDPDRGQERLGDPEREQVAVLLRERPLEPADEVSVEDVGDDEGHADREQANDDS